MGAIDWLFGSTPGQQAGQAAGEVIQRSLTGVFDGLYKIIDQFSTSDQEKLQAKMAIAEHQLKITQTVIADVQNAREMQVHTRSWMPGIMSIIAAVGFFGGFVYLLWHGLPTNIDEFTKTIINMFAGAMIVEYAKSSNFWLGSTNSSQSKDHLIYNSTPVKKE